MKKQAKLLKTLLMVLSASFLVGCPGLPTFPDWNPKMIIPSKNKVLNCQLVDKEKLLFQCSKTSIPFVPNNYDGFICTSLKETQEIIAWGKEVKKEWDQSDCKKSQMQNEIQDL